MRYRFYEGTNKVVCVSSYAKRPVKGIATCNIDHDTFDIEIGKKLAKIRCDHNVALKRNKRATEQYREAVMLLSFAEENLKHAQKYMEDSVDELKSTAAEVANMEKKLGYIV